MKILNRAICIFCISSLSVVTAINANTDKLNTNSPFTGAYTSLGIGINGTSFTHNTRSINSISGSGAILAQSNVMQTLYNLSPLGEFSAGYGFALLNSFYFGFEAFLDYTDHNVQSFLNIENSTSNPIYDLKTSSVKLSKVTAGLTAQPGIVVSPKTLFLGIIGWESAQETMRIQNQVRISNNSHGDQSAINQKRLAGLRLGLGFEQQVDKNILFGLKYIFTDFFGGGTLTTPILNTIGNTDTGPYQYSLNRSRIKSETVLANITYYWNSKAKFNSSNDVQAQGFSGFYISPQIGILNQNLSPNNTVVLGYYSDTVDNKPMLTSSPVGGSDTSTIDFAIGASKIIKDKYYLGLEGSVYWSKRDIFSNAIQAYMPQNRSIFGEPPDFLNHTFEMQAWNVQPNIDGKVGFIYNNYLLGYFRVGAGINKVGFKIANELIFNNSASNREVVNLEKTDKKSTKANLRLGVGGEYQFSQYNTFSLNYIYTYYGKFDLSSLISGQDATGSNYSLAETSKVRLKTNTVNIGYTHYFDVL